eukprot:TRINITY_DN178_c0_g1_i1.p1 TRINITY_DN178_c0_g1~~TRINITY_DN178_c0_g1_i1.p1  ORF type:complete len:160 (+),score=27.50 TRINITY_DN178_c0_g1_i1:91-570(+)
MGMFFYVVLCFVPLPLLFLLFLLCPFGHNVRRAVNSRLSKIIFFPIGGMPLIYMVLGCMSVVFMLTLVEYRRVLAIPGREKMSADARWEHSDKMHRHQRNIYIGAFVLLLWLMVYFVLRLTDRVAALEKENASLKERLDVRQEPIVAPSAPPADRVKAE